MGVRGRLAKAARGRASRGNDVDGYDDDLELSGSSSMRAAHASKVSYGLHMVVRGYDPYDSVKIGRGHNVALNGILGLYLQRTVCPPKSTHARVAACPVAVPPNASRLRLLHYVYGSADEYYTKEEDAEAEKIMEEEMRKMFRRPSRMSGMRGESHMGGLRVNHE